MSMHFFTKKLDLCNKNVLSLLHQITIKYTKMKNIEIIKMHRVEVPAEYQKEEGCIAFQTIKVVINFYGKIIEDVLDSKIMEDGTQILINGNGYIKAGCLI